MGNSLFQVGPHKQRVAGIVGALPETLRLFRPTIGFFL